MKSMIRILLFSCLALFGVNARALVICSISGGDAECKAPLVGEWWWHAGDIGVGAGHCSNLHGVYHCDSEEAAWVEADAAFFQGTSACDVDRPGLIYDAPAYILGVMNSWNRSYVLHYTYPRPACNNSVTNTTPGATVASGQRDVVCPPGYAPDTTINQCVRLKPEACPVDNPVQCAGGEKSQVEVDLPAVAGSSLEFTRYYKSTGFYGQVPANDGTDDIHTQLGASWRHTWQRSIVLEQSTTTPAISLAYAVRANGDYLKFQESAGVWQGRSDKSQSLEELQASGVRTGWRFTDVDDSVETYSADGVLQFVTTRSGLTTTLTYSDGATPVSIAPVPGLLIRVTDWNGRSLNLSYDADRMLVQVEDSAGSIYGYRYDRIDRLQYADRPASGGSRQYLYNESAYAPGATDAWELLTGIIDENGARYGTYKYDSSGRAIQEWHGASADLATYTYSGNYQSTNSSTVRVSPLGQVERRRFVAVNGILRDAGLDRCTTSACSSITASTNVTYSSDGNRDLATDFNGMATDYDYDSHGQETRRVDASNAGGVDAATKRTTETTWNATFRVPDQRTVKNSTGAVETQTKWTYNSRGQATARCQIDPAVSSASSYACGSSTNAPTGVRQTLTTYCESADITAGTCPLVGLVTSVNGARLTTDAGMGGGDDVTTYTYRMADDSTCASAGACTYRKGDLWKVTNAICQVIEYASYDKNGRVTRMKDANGTYTDFAYHARGWLTDRTVRANSLGTADPGDATLHIDYDAVGNVTQVTQPDGAYLHYTYDDAHRLIKISDNLSNSIDYCPGGAGTADCLDAAGNRKVEQVKDPSNAVKRQLHRVYNQLGQLTQVLNAASVAVETSAGIGGTNIADGYDRNGNRIYKDDGLGVRTEQDYDPLNRLKATIQNLAGTDTATQNTTTGYTYDTRDNLRQVTDPDGLNTVYTYDGLNNLTDLDSPDTGHTHYAYDAAGNRTSQTDNRTPSVTSTYTYDALNRLIAITYPTTGLDVSYAYDQSNAVTGCSASFPLGRLTRMTDATGSTTYCYDRRGNVTKKTQVTGSTTLAMQYTYTKADRVATITYPSGGLATYTRDALGRIAGITWTPAGIRTATALVSSTAYLPFGALTTLTFGNGRTLTKAYDQDYAIDSISGTPAGALTLDLGVDVMGDITSASGTLGASPADRVYGYDALYRLKTSQTGASGPFEAYTYNKTGDRTSASLNGGAASAYTYATGTHHLASVGGVARTYDGNGNTLTGTSPGLTLTYDNRNRLASMVNGTTSATYAITGRGERVGKTVMVSGTPTTTLFGYDEGGRLTGEYTGAGAIQTEYIYLDNIPVGVFKGGTLYYVETDHLGTPRQVVKPTGNVVVWKWDFLQNTFGNSVPNQDPDGDAVPFVLGMRFPGQYYDAETGLNYNYFREYDALSGRYLEGDPIGLHGGISLYLYCGGRPHCRDAFGLQSRVDLGNDYDFDTQFTFDQFENEYCSVIDCSPLTPDQQKGACKVRCVVMFFIPDPKELVKISLDNAYERIKHDCKFVLKHITKRVFVVLGIFEAGKCFNCCDNGCSDG